MIVDDDAAVDLQAGLATELDVRADARCDHDQLGVDTRAVRELDRLGRRAAADRFGAASEEHADAQGFHPRRQVAPTRGIELTLHEGVHQVHDRDVAALHLEASRRFETEQPAADHDGPGAGSGAAEQGARVVERAEREHPVLVEPFDGRHPGGAAGREEQGVEGGHGAVL